MIGVGTSVAGPVVDPYYESKCRIDDAKLSVAEGNQLSCAELYLGGSQLD